MSTCISRAGEYGEHVLTDEGDYICARCGILDEDGLFAECVALRAKVARVEALAEEWGATGRPILLGAASRLRTELWKP